MNITGGRDGKTAKVTSEHRLAVDSVQVSREHYINHVTGKAYTLVFNASPATADDCILYVQNTDTEDMCVEGFTIGVTNCSADDSIYFKLGDTGTRASATDITPVSVNGGSGEVATGVFEKGTALNGGTLDGGSEFERYIMAGITDLKSSDFNFQQDVILPKNRTLTAYIGGSAVGTWYLTMHFNYHPDQA